VSTLEREETRCLRLVIEWSEAALRTQEQLAKFGEGVLTLLAIEQEAAAKMTLGGSSTTGSTRSNVTASRGTSLESSRVTSPVNQMKSTTTARGGRSPTRRCPFFIHYRCTIVGHMQRVVEDNGVLGAVAIRWGLDNQTANVRS